jgi:hypothetical protein
MVITFNEIGFVLEITKKDIIVFSIFIQLKTVLFKYDAIADT